MHFEENTLLKTIFLPYSQYTFSVCSSTYYMDFVNRLHVCPVDGNKYVDNVAVVYLQSVS